MDQVSLAVDKRPHLGVPTTGPMAKMDAGFNQVLHVNKRHATPFRQESLSRDTVRQKSIVFALAQE